MRRMNVFVASLALPAMMIAGLGQASASRAAQSAGDLAGSGASICRVKVSRSADAGVFDVTRQILNNGKCVCRVTTGPRSQGGSAESALAGLLLRRTCADAPLADAGAPGGGGLGGSGVLIGAGVLVAGGLAAALASGGSGSP